MINPIVTILISIASAFGGAFLHNIITEKRKLSAQVIGQDAANAAVETITLTLDGKAVANNVVTLK
jgi:hypothetical protein